MKKNETATLTAANVESIYSTFYESLREETGENGPSSYVYFGTDPESVSENEGLEFLGYNYHLGSESQTIVIAAYFTENCDWYAIHSDATEDQVRKFFEDCAGI